MLGYNRYNVFGLSYGTYLAQTLMRDHPEGIRSVILDSAVPIERSRYPDSGPPCAKVSTICSKLAQAQASCRETGTTPEGHFHAARARVPGETADAGRGQSSGQGHQGRAGWRGAYRLAPQEGGLRHTPAASGAGPNQRIGCGAARVRGEGSGGRTVVSEPLEGFGLAFGASCREWNPSGRMSRCETRLPRLSGLNSAPIGRFVCVYSVKIAIRSGGFRPARPQFAAHPVPTSRPC